MQNTRPITIKLSFLFGINLRSEHFWFNISEGISYEL